MIKKFEEFIKEGLISKTIMRSKTGEVRKETLDGLTREEYKIYELLSEWCKGGQLNIENPFKTNLSFNGDWEKFERILMNSLIELNCKQIRGKLEIENAIQEHNAVFIFNKLMIQTMQNYPIDIYGLIDNKQTMLTTTYFDKDNVKVIINNFYKENFVSFPKEDADKVYKAFIIPLNVFEKVIKQNNYEI